MEWQPIDSAPDAATGDAGMTQENLIDKITEILFDLICEGGGDGETLREYAEIIAELMEKNDD